MVSHPAGWKAVKRNSPHFLHSVLYSKNKAMAHYRQKVYIGTQESKAILFGRGVEGERSLYDYRGLIKAAVEMEKVQIVGQIYATSIEKIDMSDYPEISVSRIDLNAENIPLRVVSYHRRDRAMALPLKQQEECHTLKPIGVDRFTAPTNCDTGDMLPGAFAFDPATDKLIGFVSHWNGDFARLGEDTVKFIEALQASLAVEADDKNVTITWGDIKKE